MPTAAVFGAFLTVQAFARWFGPDERLIASFGMDGEHNVPATWNAILLLVVAGVAVGLSVLTPADRRPSAPLWRAAALAAVYLALDETLSIHERLGGPTTALADRLGVSLPTYAWLLPGAVLASVGVWLGARWFSSLPLDVKIGLTAAGVAYLAGALLLEAVNGALWHAGLRQLYAMSTGVEELLEMVACVIATATLLRLVDVDPASRVATLRPVSPGPAPGPEQGDVLAGHVGRDVEAPRPRRVRRISPPRN